MMNNQTARIFKVEQLNTHNGPGYRTVIFFKGCPLHCTWCHNPEGINRANELWFIPSKCIGCGSCIEVCPEKSLTMGPNGIEINRETCTLCFDCVEVCPTHALEQIGREVTVDQLMKTILKDKIYFDTSGGGITATGGDPGLYPEFIAELFRRCREIGVNTAFDTSGAVPLQKLENVLQHTDILYLDFKISDAGDLLHYTGLDSKSLAASVEWIKEFKKEHALSLRIRTPLIPEITDNPENLLTIARYIHEIGEDQIDEWELCSFNGLCADKYQKLDLDWTIAKPETNWEMSDELRQFLALNFKKLAVLAPGYH